MEKSGSKMLLTIASGRYFFSQRENSFSSHSEMISGGTLELRDC